MKNFASAHFMLLLTITLFNQCKPERRENHLIINKFPEVIELESESIPQIRNSFFPMQMGLKDSILIFCDFENSPHFHAYVVPEFKYMGSFGENGRGPGELQSPSFWGQIDKQNEKYYMWIYQMDLTKLVLIDIQKAITDTENEFKNIVDIPLTQGEAINVIALKNDIYVGSGGDAKGEFFLFNHSSNDLNWRDFFVDALIQPEISNPDVIAEVKRGIIKLKPDGTKYVKALVYAPVIDVYNSDGTHNVSLSLSGFEKPVIKDGEFDGISRIYYENLYLTDNYIYALNRNCTINDYMVPSEVEIHVFNWLGDPVCKYLLNEGIGPMAPFVVDEANRRIYTVNPKDEYDIFSLFDINHNPSLN